MMRKKTVARRCGWVVPNRTSTLDEVSASWLGGAIVMPPPVSPHHAPIERANADDSNWVVAEAGWTDPSMHPQLHNGAHRPPESSPGHRSPRSVARRPPYSRGRRPG